MFLDFEHDVGFVVQTEGRAHLVHVGSVHLHWQFAVGSDQRIRRTDLADIVSGDVRVALLVDGSERVWVE